jgi:hypothetical protein
VEQIDILFGANAELLKISCMPKGAMQSDGGIQESTQRGKKMNNAEKFREVFGMFATEVWSMPEDAFLKWLKSDTKSESVEPRKIAHWNHNGFEWKASCSECGESCATYSMGQPRDRYCKWCGAKMEEGEDDATN